MIREIAQIIIEKFQFLNAIPMSFIYITLYIVVGGIILGFVSALVIFLVWLERKVSAHMQSRLGPMRVGGWHGWAQTIADGIKLFLKEDIIPEKADRTLFIMAPYIVFVGSFASFVAIPFGKGIIVSDLNIGIFYILSISSMVVIGILMSGWSSNNKWSLYGAMRSAAQMISYEVPIALSILSVVLLVGDLSMVQMTKAQEGGILNWHIFRNPFAFISFFIYLIASIAEVNRIPFDLPEAESELVAGYHTEYSGIRFSFFFLAEYANMFLVSSIASVLFLGGWQGFGKKTYLEGTIFFLSKAMFLVFVMMWLRWTLPRLRVDQLMGFCWKFLLPISFFTLIGTGIWMLV